MHESLRPEKNIFINEFLLKPDMGEGLGSIVATRLSELQENKINEILFVLEILFFNKMSITIYNLKLFSNYFVIIESRRLFNIIVKSVRNCERPTLI